MRASAMPRWKAAAPILLLLAALALFALRGRSVREGADRGKPPDAAQESGIGALLQARSAANAAPKDRALRLRHAELLRGYRFLPAARREYTEILRLFPDDPEAVRGLAGVRMEQGQGAEAAALLLALAVRDPAMRLD